MYYHADHLGGANVLTDATGFKKELIEYEPFGQESRHEKYGSSEEVAWFYFTGKKTDDESGLIYFGARYYDPSLGRFIQPDTIVPYPSDPQSFNRYSYARNNPVNVIDPTGHKWSWKKFWNSFAGAFVGAVVTVLTGGNFALGGMVGGAITGGLEGGWKGALIGGALGGALGGVAGIGIDKWGTNFGIGMLVAGAGVAGATNSWDSFAGGIAGGIIGSQVGNGIDSYFNDGIGNEDPATGIRAGTGSEGNENWEVLGIGTGQEEAAKHALQNQTSVFYTKSRGPLADLVRAGIQKVRGNSLASRQFAGYLKGASGKFIYAHSEGTLTLSGAAKALAVDGVKLKNTIFDWNAPVIARSTASNIASSVGASSQYHLNWLDPIGVFTTYNPVQTAVYGTVGVTTFATSHSTKYYRNPIY